MTAADVEVFLDLREWQAQVSQAEQFQQLWAEVEQALHGRPLEVGQVHALAAGTGQLRVGVAWIRPGTSAQVHAGTRFRIVNVLEPLPERYLCTVCAAAGRRTYGPFRCVDCTDRPGERRCADHAEFLAGSLLPTCDRHRPRCAECRGTATFRCAGPHCAGRTAHCDRHRVADPQEPDLAICPRCHAARYPSCAYAGCGHVATVECEYVEPGGRPCARTVCARHLGRWQVYGPQKVGLALCAAHQESLPRLTPQGLLRQVVAGTYRRSLGLADAEPLPSLRALAHTLRNHQHHEWALDHHKIHAAVCRAPDDLGALAPAGQQAGQGAGQLAAMLRERDRGRNGAGSGGRGKERRGARPGGTGAAVRGWQEELRELDRGTDVGARLIEQLRAVVRDRLGAQGEPLARSLALAQYHKPRKVDGQERPALLYVRVPPEHQRLFEQARGHASQELSRGAPAEVRVLVDRIDRSPRPGAGGAAPRRNGR